MPRAQVVLPSLLPCSSLSLLWHPLGVMSWALGGEDGVPLLPPCVLGCGDWLNPGEQHKAAPHWVGGAEGALTGRRRRQPLPYKCIPSFPTCTGGGLQHHFKWHFLHIFLLFQTQINLTSVWYCSPLCCPVSTEQG